MSTRGSQTPTTFIIFHTNYDYSDRLFLIIKELLSRSSLHNTQNPFTIVH